MQELTKIEVFIFVFLDCEHGMLSLFLMSAEEGSKFTPWPSPFYWEVPVGLQKHALGSVEGCYAGGSCERKWNLNCLWYIRLQSRYGDHKMQVLIKPSRCTLQLAATHSSVRALPLSASACKTRGTRKKSVSKRAEQRGSDLAGWRPQTKLFIPAHVPCTGAVPAREGEAEWVLWISLCFFSLLGCSVLTHLPKAFI